MTTQGGVGSHEGARRGGVGLVGTIPARRRSSEGHQLVSFDDFSTGLESNLTGLDVAIQGETLVDATAKATGAAGADAIGRWGLKDLCRAQLSTRRHTRGQPHGDAECA